MNETERTMEHDPGGAGATVDGMEGFDNAEGFDSTLEDIFSYSLSPGFSFFRGLYAAGLSTETGSTFSSAVGFM